MLDEYCKKLSDEAQLKIALRLCREALPIWEAYMRKDDKGLETLNTLITEQTRVQGGLERIDNGFLERTLTKIEKSYFLAKEKNELPLPLMKLDVLLNPLLATSSQVLTNDKWDSILTRSVRLAYTSVWNILVWILYRRKNDAGETHIYISINQAADALMLEEVMTVEQINALLMQYETELRSENEDNAWEDSFVPSRTGSEPESAFDEAMKKIIAPQPAVDKPNEIQVIEVLRQMREENKSYWNMLDEYYSGTCSTYSYNKEKQEYWLSEADVIVGSFFNEYTMSEEAMRTFISERSLADLRDSDFEI